MTKNYVLIKREFRGGITSVHGPRHNKSDGERAITHDDFHDLYGLFMTQNLAYAENLLDENTSFETIPAIANDAEIGYIVEVEL